MKHLVDIDDALLVQAQAFLRTSTIRATVEEALRIAADRRSAELNAAADGLAEILSERPPFDRSQAW